MKQFRVLALGALACLGAAMITTACKSEQEHHGSQSGSKMQGEQGEEADEEDAEEAKIPFDTAPEAVRAAIRKLAPGQSIGQVERDTEDGLTTFEVEYTSAGGKVTASLSETGEILEIERDAPTLPDAVTKAIAKAMPGAKVVKSESIQVFMYEVVVEKDGKRQEIKIAPNGEMDEEDED